MIGRMQPESAQCVDLVFCIVRYLVVEEEVVQRQLKDELKVGDPVSSKNNSALCSARDFPIRLTLLGSASASQNQWNPVLVNRRLLEIKNNGSP